MYTVCQQTNHLGPQHLELNNLPIWQYVTKLTYKMNCSISRTTQIKDMPKI